MTERFRIGQLAESCGVSRDTIRFYERAGLLPKPRRTATRHRLYDDKTAEDIRFIRRAQELGLTLDDIRQLIELRAMGTEGIARIDALLRTRLESIQARLTSFEKYRDRLQDALRTLRQPGGVPNFLEFDTDDDRSLREA